MRDCEKAALDSIKNGSRSFDMASRFFRYEERVSAAQIYRWCRYCDDIIDEGKATAEILDQLKKNTASCWNQTNDAPPEFLSFRDAVLRSHIPQIYAEELLSGLEMDLQKKRYRTLAELKLYCYRVASTVGLMMCHVMGLFSQRSLEHAASLGMAMQITNICRDVKADWEIGRLYLPTDWLNLVGLDETNYFDLAFRGQLFLVLKKLLSEAEALYQHGLAGTRNLPWRSALAVLIAARLYREIGREIIRQGMESLEQRTVVGKSRKIWLVALAIFDLIQTLPHRLLRKQRKETITQIWVYSC